MSMPKYVSNCAEYFGETLVEFLAHTIPVRRAMLIEYFESLDVTVFNYAKGYALELRHCNPLSHKWLVSGQGVKDNSVTYINRNGNVDYLNVETKHNVSDVVSVKGNKFIIYEIDRHNSQQDTTIAPRIIPMTEWIEFTENPINKAINLKKGKYNPTSKRLIEALENYPNIYEDGMTVEWWMFEGVRFGE